MSGNIEKKGQLVVLAAPSGGGKEVTMNGLVEKCGYSRVITCCAGRPIRSDEKDGIDYHFLSVEEFNKAITNDEFIEWFPYRETLKGTKKGELQRAENEVLIWRIDPATAAGVKDLLRSKGLDNIADNTITVYIGIPEVRFLFKRQMQRDPQPERVTVLNRMRGDWEDWKKHGKRYDFVVMNEEGKLDNTISQVQEIIERSLVS